MEARMHNLPAARHPSRKYQWLLIALLSLNFGVVFLDRNAFSFLVPFIQPELKLTNSQIGFIAAALSFSWAIAGLFVGRLSDRLGRRKIILVVCTIVFSAASLLSGFAGTFAALFAARLLMGIAEGGIMPISQTLIAAEVAAERRGLAQGITQNFGANLIANFAGPLIIVAVAAAAGWRNAFFIAAAPGLILALLIALLVREVPTARDAGGPPATRGAGGAVARLLRDRTIRSCILISIVLVSFFGVFMTFVPLYLVQVSGLGQGQMSWVLSAFGLTSIAFALLVPGLSDRIGRKPVMLGVPVVGLAIALGLGLGGNSVLLLTVCIGLGAALSGLFPIAMATIPSEIAPAREIATAMSLTMGISEILGGVLSPIGAGWLADRYGLGVVPWLLAGVCVAVILLALSLRETAPARVGQVSAG
jgi:MFS family permease